VARKRRLKRVDPVNLANFLTLLRILMVPVFLILLAKDQGRPGLADDYCKIWAMVVFFLASLTDYLDGKIARDHGLVTRLGKFMDPLADKLLVCSAFVMFVDFGWIPAWVLIALLWREFLVTGLRTQLAADGITLASSRWAKFKTIFQVSAIVAIMIVVCLKVIALSGDVEVPLSSMVYYSQIASSLVLICVLFSVVSGLEYFDNHGGAFRRG